MRRLKTLLALCIVSITTLVAAAPAKPKLVLAIVIDQFRYDYLLRFRKDYNSGLARLLDRGAVYTDAHYLHSHTVTAIGHSTFLSGATPSVSGIIANEWYDRASKSAVTSVSDPNSKLVGGKTGAGSSPRRLLVSTVGDELKSQGGDSKVIGVSIKDRSAILPAGHMADGAYWYDDSTHSWVTSTFYRETLPDWAQKINDARPEKKYEGMKWMPFDGKGEPFCTMGAAQRGLCRSAETAPWGNEMIEEFAEGAIAGENLGKHNSTDILAVSFSANDYVGHAVGPDDPAVRDMAIRTDRLLGKLFDVAARQSGADNVLVILTADHGVAPLPELNQRRKMPGGRINGDELVKKIDAALTAKFGGASWVVYKNPANIYLNQEQIATLKLDPAAVETAAADAIRNEPHVARVVTRHELASGRVQQDAIGRAMSVAFFAPRSGDLFVLQEPFYLFEQSGASHGTPYDYDTHIPVIFMGSGIKAAIHTRRIASNDIAPTLSAILGVAQPGGSIGQVLTELFQ